MADHLAWLTDTPWSRRRRRSQPFRQASLGVLGAASLVVLIAGLFFATGTTAAVTAQGTTLHGGQTLEAGQALHSGDGAYSAVMQTDGNLVVYDAGRNAVWASGTAGRAGARVVMQQDGNLVVYTPDGRAVWDAGTSGNTGVYAVMQSDGNFVLYGPGGRPLWSSFGGRTGLSTSTLHAGQALEAGQALHSGDGAYSAAMQTDGNLVVYDAGRNAVWASGTAGRAGARLVMQRDGNLVVYTPDGRAVWDAGTSGNTGAYAVMQSDGNFVLYGPSRPLWSSRTGLLQLPVLKRGDEGPAVADLQRRLEELRFWVGPVNGVYSWLTEQAVFAFQKANGIPVDGTIDDRDRGALAAPALPSPQSTSGRVMEIDKTRQLLYAVLDGELQWIFHTSTGTEEPYRHPGGYTAMADTPPGRHTVDWQVDGWHDGRLGRMYRPKYFHPDGIALHGYHAIPPHPASHGCARVTFDAMDFIWAQGLMPVGSVVLVYGTSPPPGPAV